MRKIDGSQGEGGGSILRLASALALINEEKVKIENIRKKRPTSGLRPQQLLGLQALTEIWGDSSYFSGRSMDVFVSKLRKYLKHDNRSYSF